jgi:hypothetical protein
LAETWEAVLDRLEADLAALEGRLSAIPLAVEAAPGDRAEPWTPPRGLGPLPEALGERARAVEAAQARLAVRLEQVRATAARHLTAVSAIPPLTHGQPVYLDVEG